MTKKLEAQTKFNGGEITPRMFARVGLESYDKGLETATNCFVTPHGPVHRRTGSQYIAEVKTSANAVHLESFQFSTDDSYILEFGNNYIRFFKDSGVVGGPYEVTTTYTTAEVPNLSFAQFGDILYIAHPDHAPATLTRTSDTDWTLADLATYPPPTYEKGEFPADTVTPAATSGSAVNFTCGSALFVKADIGRQIQNQAGAGRAAITGYTSTTVVVCTIVEDFPNTNAIASGDWKLDLSPLADLTPDGTQVGSMINISADEAGGTTAVDTFRTGDVGKYILIAGGVLQIVTRTSGSVVECECLKALDATTETANWTLETETWDSTRGYPKAVGLYQERLVFGGTVAEPQTLWFSEQGIFDGFGVGPDDEDAIQVDLSGTQVNEISWLATSRDLVVGTTGTESTISSGSTGTAITPSTIRQDTRTFHGSAGQVPIAVGNEVLFIQKSQRKVRTFRFDFAIDSYAAENLHEFAEHITSGLIKEIAYAQEPDSQIYCVDEDGDMLVGTYRRDQKIIGWCKYTTDGSYENVQTITVGEVDQVWVVVNRTINGSTVRYVELFETGDGSDRLHGYSDCFLTYSDPKLVSAITAANPPVVTTATHGYSDGDTVKFVDIVGMTELNNLSFLVANKTATTFELTDLSGTNIDASAYTAYVSGGESHKLVSSISGLTHLEAESVQIKADGATHPAKTVASGAITLDRNAFEVVVGMSYTTTIKTLRREYDIGTGTMQGQRSRWTRPIVRTYKSAKPLLNGEFLPSRSAGDNMDQAVPLFSGDLEYGPLTWDNVGQLTFTLSDPLPLQLQGIFGALEGGIK